MNGDDTDVKGIDSDKTEEPKTNQVVSDAKAVDIDGGGDVSMAGAGVGRGVFGTGAKEFSESDGGSDCSDVDQKASESGILDMESGDGENDEEDEESADTEDNDNNDTDVSFMNPKQLRQSPIIVKEPIRGNFLIYYWFKKNFFDTKIIIKNCTFGDYANGD